MDLDPDSAAVTCGACGAECEPEPVASEGLGVRFLLVCPVHGPQETIDPFDHLR